MNEERALVIGLSAEGLLPAEAAGRVLRALLDLEVGRPDAIPVDEVDPLCQPPPWLEVSDDPFASLWQNDLPTVMVHATREIVDSLHGGDIGRAAFRLAMLDAMYLARFRMVRPCCSFSTAGVQLAEGEGALHTRGWSLGVSISTDRDAGIPALFGQPLVGWVCRCPVPVAHHDEPLAFSAEQDGGDHTATAAPDLEAVTTSLGTFDRCLKVSIETAGGGGGTPPGTCTLWLAPDAGPVRMVLGDPAGATAQYDVTSAVLQGGHGFLPLARGNVWRMERAGAVEMELWRVLAAKPEGCWISAAHFAGIDE